MSKHVSEIECALCGLDGGPVPACGLCHGNPRFVQSRAFTVSEEKQGLNQEEKQRRYGPYGNVGPRIVNLPGGVIPGAPQESAPAPLSEEALAEGRIEPVSEAPEPTPKPRARRSTTKKPAAKRSTRTRKPGTPKAE